MPTLTVAADGQITLSKVILQHLDVQPREKIIVDELPGGRIEVKADRPTGQTPDVFNFLERENAPSLPIEEINRLAADAWAGKR